MLPSLFLCLLSHFDPWRYFIHSFVEVAGFSRQLNSNCDFPCEELDLMVFHNEIVTTNSRCHKEGVDVFLYMECLGFKSAQPIGCCSPHVYDQGSMCCKEVVVDKSSSSHQSGEGDPSYEVQA